MTSLNVTVGVVCGRWWPTRGTASMWISGTTLPETATTLGWLTTLTQGLSLYPAAVWVYIVLISSYFYSSVWSHSMAFSTMFTDVVWSLHEWSTMVVGNKFALEITWARASQITHHSPCITLSSYSSSSWCSVCVPLFCRKRRIFIKCSTLVVFSIEGLISTRQTLLFSSCKFLIMAYTVCQCPSCSATIFRFTEALVKANDHLLLPGKDG